MTKSELKRLANLLAKYQDDKFTHLRAIGASHDLHDKIIDPIRTVKHRVSNEYYELNNKKWGNKAWQSLNRSIV